MKQPVAGVAPPQLAEVTVAMVWPSIAATRLGRWLGRLYAIDVGLGWLTIGKLAALASIPLALLLFFAMLWLWSSRRYRLTNRRMLVERGARANTERSIDFGAFDRLEIDVLPGQAWFPAGDLVFFRDAREVFRLPGVPRPEGFRQTILKTACAFAPRDAGREGAAPPV